MKETTNKAKVKYSTRENIMKSTLFYGENRSCREGTVKITERETAKSRQMGPSAISCEYLQSILLTQRWWKHVGVPTA